jgi:hypothetical protein
MGIYPNSIFVHMPSSYKTKTKTKTIGRHTYPSTKPRNGVLHRQHPQLHQQDPKPLVQPRVHHKSTRL